jgi:flagellar biosynthetic protein FliP
MKANRAVVLLMTVLALFILQDLALAQTAGPKLNISVDRTTQPDEIVTTLQIVLLLTILSLAPSIIMMMTSFTRIIIVFHFLRQSLATQTVPSNQILVGLALFITFFVMKPVITEVNDNAIQPYLDNRISQQEAYDNGIKPIRAFMLKHTREKDLQLFIDLQQGEKPTTVDEIPTTSLIPAFIISELKTAFQIGFLLYLPMLLIDLIVGSVLLSMGMMMLPPVMISMPFKILLFVLVDGWYLVVESLVKGF